MPGRRRLPRATPESQGLPSAAVTGFLDAVAEAHQELHSLMVVVRGAVVAEGWWAPYERERRHELFSLSKSFTSTAVGFAQAEGLLSVDDLVLDHFPDEAPTEPDPNLGRMRVRHLLTMTTGHHDAADDGTFGSPDWARGFLAQPVQHEPGTHFVYNTAGSYMLSAIVQRVTGQRALDYLTPRLLEPLGIEGVTWQQSPQGIDAGGFGIWATTEDIACFAQLYLQDGMWDGRRVLPEGWVADASRPHTVSTHSNGDPDWVQGYGYQLWRGRHSTFRGDGAFGQFALVLPEQHAVVAVTSGSDNMQGILDLVWHLLAAMPTDQGAVLAPDPGGEAELAERLAGLRLDPSAWTGAAPFAADVAGRTITLEPNGFGITSAVIEPGAERTRITVVGPTGQVMIDAGHGAWVAGRIPEDTPDGIRRNPTRSDLTQAVVAAVGWPAPDTMVLELRLIETAFMLRLTAVFDGAVVRVGADLNAWFGPSHIADVVGRLEG